VLSSLSADFQAHGWLVHMFVVSDDMQRQVARDSWYPSRRCVSSVPPNAPRLTSRGLTITNTASMIGTIDTKHNHTTRPTQAAPHTAD